MSERMECEILWISDVHMVLIYGVRDAAIPRKDEIVFSCMHRVCIWFGHGQCVTSAIQMKDAYL